ncbi:MULTISPECIES: PglL family O-oligosaccharyltransferase [unclassified Methylophaga]|uniref:PglL family O-oligosaccharyltransferase n=1 Tax=unclassified Methylophaga TaxID=2629249 RepID=UPI0025CF033B|nr:MULTISPECIES: O-antigen ligase family protein [unclassified Methylophaga]
MSEAAGAPPNKISKINLITCGLLALLCILPFLIPHHRIPLTTFYNQWSAIALGVLAMIFLLRKQSWEELQIPWFALMPLGLLVIVAIQYKLGLFNYWQQSFLVCLYLLWASLLITLGAQLKHLLTLEKLIPTLAWALVVGGLISAVIVTLQYLGWDDSPLILRYKSGGFAANLGQVNHLATYMALALGSLLYLYLSQRINFWALAITAIVFLMVLALTGQRMSWLYVILLSVGGWLIARKSTQWQIHFISSRLLWLIPVFILVQLVLPLFSADMPAMPAERVAENVKGESIRLLLIQQAWEMFIHHPLWGIGWGQFGWHNFEMTESYPGLNGYADHAHNMLLHLLAETGIFGGLILLSGIIFWFWQQRGVVISAERWWLYAILAVFAVHSLLEYPLWYAYFLGLAAIVTGISSERNITLKLNLGIVVSAALLLFSLFMLSNTFMQYSKVENWYTKGRMGLFNNDQAVPLLYEMAETRDKSLFAPYLDLVIIRALPDTQEVLPDKLAMNTQLMKYLPGEEEVYNQVTLLALSDQPEAASHQLDLAMRHYPKYMDKYWKVATRGLLVGGHKQLFPLIQQLQNYQDTAYPLEP